jgi:hypothetical protein
MLVRSGHRASILQPSGSPSFVLVLVVTRSKAAILDRYTIDTPDAAFQNRSHDDS